ncbi:O-methyltransferase [Rhodococcus sp. NPDC003318]|uniref:O-methyltransferase n=1 Tax=Rhodococcus sp. NPDC003318 TaxID=3364503 RepID=UPI0036AD6333
MTSSLTTEPLAGILARLYDADAAGRTGRPRGTGRHHSTTATAQERADAASDIYMPISPDTGRLAYSLIRASRPAQIVEFGMSYGISTLHLAAAVRDNGVGHIHTTEMSAKKIAQASATFAEAGIDDLVTVLEGDALTTLGEVTGPIGFVLLDGWKDLYLPVLTLLEDRLPSGTLVLADNAESADAMPYLDYVRDPGNGYTSVNLPGKRHDTIELSCRT